MHVPTSLIIKYWVYPQTRRVPSVITPLKCAFKLPPFPLLVMPWSTYLEIRI